ncbi:MAG: hypothetical protein WC668_02750 [Patescibacteria group bacterium]|jgi:hypothetical protein
MAKGKCPACFKVEVAPGQWKNVALPVGEETFPQYCPKCAEHNAYVRGSILASKRLADAALASASGK